MPLLTKWELTVQAVAALVATAVALRHLVYHVLNSGGFRHLLDCVTQTFHAPKLILSLPTLGAALGAATLASPQVLARPVPGAQLALLLPALVPSLKAFTRSSTVVVAIALRAEMDNLLLPALASFDHLLFALARTRTRLVAGHVFLTYCHISSSVF